MLCTCTCIVVSVVDVLGIPSCLLMVLIMKLIMIGAAARHDIMHDIIIARYDMYILQGMTGCMFGGILMFPKLLVVWVLLPYVSQIN